MNPITIIGSGMVGLLCATLLTRAAIPVTIIGESQLDTRVSALNAMSLCLLKDYLNSEEITPLCKLTVWDSVSGSEIHFDCADIGAPRLGAIVQNRDVILSLKQALQKNNCIQWITDARPVELSQQTHQVDIRLDNQQQITTPLVIGADGGHSWVRSQMSVDTTERSYKQSAIIAVVHTTESHGNTGWQVFLSPEKLGGGEVLALLPLQNPHHCSIVWSVPTERAELLLQLDETQFNQILNNSFGVRLGEIKRLTKPQAIPLVMRHAKQYVQARIALIGDAAHTIHPLAGQGANLGFMDAACLAQCVIEAYSANQDVGSLRVLRRYERWRKGDNTMMLLAMRGLKELFNTASPLAVSLRTHGIAMASHSQLIKNCLMRLAMGARRDLPEIIQKYL